MDCEKFDLHVMDALYDELDELTYAALRRHVDGCSRCAAAWSELRATREVGVLPMVQPSDDLEDRILEAAFTAQKRTPMRRKVLRGLAWAGSHAMRPQFAMAALFFLVIGSSLLLLRAKPGTLGGTVRVTERGAPTPEAEPVPASAAAPFEQAAAASASAAPAQEPDALRKTLAEAGKSKDAAKEKAEGAKAALADARGIRDKSGCAAAVGKFDEVGARFPATAIAADAMWEEAVCYKNLGESAKARELLLALKANSAYRERVEQELAEEAVASNNMQHAPPRARKAMAAAPAAAAPPKAAPAAKPQGTAVGGSAGKAVSAPRKAAADNAL